MCIRDSPGSVAGVTYDESVYYAVVRNVAKGAGIQTSVEYYKAETDGTVKQLDENDTPVFTNIYSVDVYKRQHCCWQMVERERSTPSPHAVVRL